MSEENVTIVVENNQSGNIMFPGWKKKYKELYNIPENSKSENAVVVDIDSDEVDGVIETLRNGGLGVQKADEIEKDEKSPFAKVLGWFSKEDEEDAYEGGEGNPPPQSNTERWMQVFNRLNKEGKKKYKGFKPEKLSEEDLKAEIEEVQTFLVAQQPIR